MARVQSPPFGGVRGRPSSQGPSPVEEPIGQQIADVRQLTEHAEAAASSGDYQQVSSHAKTCLQLIPGCVCVGHKLQRCPSAAAQAHAVTRSAIPWTETGAQPLVRDSMRPVVDHPGNGSMDGSALWQALDDYTTIVRRHPGLAITEYARLSRALMLFQNGRADDAVLQLDDLRVSMVGCVSACGMATWLYAAMRLPCADHLAMLRSQLL